MKELVINGITAIKREDVNGFEFYTAPTFPEVVTLGDDLNLSTLGAFSGKISLASGDVYFSSSNMNGVEVDLINNGDRTGSIVFVYNNQTLFSRQVRYRGIERVTYECLPWELFAGDVNINLSDIVVGVAVKWNDSETEQPIDKSQLTYNINGESVTDATITTQGVTTFSVGLGIAVAPHVFSDDDKSYTCIFTAYVLESMTLQTNSEMEYGESLDGIYATGTYSDGAIENPHTITAMVLFNENEVYKCHYDTSEEDYVSGWVLGEDNYIGAEKGGITASKASVSVYKSIRTWIAYGSYEIRSQYGCSISGSYIKAYSNTPSIKIKIKEPNPFRRSNKYIDSKLILLGGNTVLSVVSLGFAKYEETYTYAFGGVTQVDDVEIQVEEYNTQNLTITSVADALDWARTITVYNPNYIPVSVFYTANKATETDAGRGRFGDVYGTIAARSSASIYIGDTPGFDDTVIAVRFLVGSTSFITYVREDAFGSNPANTKLDITYV